MSEDINLSEFAGEWLKAEMIEKYPNVLIPVGFGRQEDQIYLEVEYAGVKYKFRLNKTNVKAIMSKGYKQLSEVVGKAIKIDKIRVNNPATKQACDSIAIVDIEEAE